MKLQVKFLMWVNKFFKLPVHPFNLQNDGVKTYSMWQYEKGAETIKNFMNYTTKEEMMEGKTVLDIGCGAAGKSLYYASLGAEKVHGVDVVEHYEAESTALAEKLGLSDRIEFHLCDAAKLVFPENTFDTIIMNDSMEHVAQPEKVLEQCERVLKHGGKLYVNFCPYYHPYGAHLSDAIGIPWVHMFFGETTMIEAYKELIKGLPDEESRLEFRFSKNENGVETISYINHMTIKRFKKVFKTSGMSIRYYNEIPLRSIFKILAKLPLLKEMFVKMTVCVLEKK